MDGLPETIEITYRIMPRDSGSTIEIPLQLQSATLELIGNQPAELPGWTKLDYHKCSNCPLSAETHPHCPLAANLVNIIDRFEAIRSYDKVRLEVITEERRISQMTTAQKAISSLMGLISAASGCPNTAFFKPMARYHLPLSSGSETMYRVISMYLFAQYFRKAGGQMPDTELDGLLQIYQDVEVVNQHIARRLSAHTMTDSSLNAIVILDLYAKTLPLLIVDNVLTETLDEMRSLFSSYLDSTGEREV